MNNLKRILFGSSDRILSTISLFIGLLSFGFTIFTYSYPTPIPTVIIIRDLLLVGFLVLFICVLCLKYFKKDNLVERFRNLLRNQLVSCHQLEHKFRNHFFSEIRQTLVERNLSTEKIKDISEKYFQKVCHSTLTDTRKIFQEYFLSRGFKTEDDITVTLKTVISHDEAQRLLSQFRGEKADTLSSKQEYIVTAFRDPDTWERKPKRKEVKQVVYRINEENTAFDLVLNKGQNYFLSNDLKNLHDSSKYRNANPDWQLLYNSTLIVPIRYIHDEKTKASTKYGILAVDSLNLNKHDLFDDTITVNMLAHSADTLALMFGHLEIMEMLKENIK